MIGFRIRDEAGGDAARNDLPLRGSQRGAGQGQRGEVGRPAGRPGGGVGVRSASPPSCVLPEVTLRRAAREPGRALRERRGHAPHPGRPAACRSTTASSRWTVAQLREHVLDDTTRGADLLRLSRGLTQRDDRRLRQADDQPRSGLRRARRSASSSTPPTRVGLPGRLSVAPAAEPPVGLDRRDPGLAARGAVATASATRSSASTRSPTTRSRRAAILERHAASSCAQWRIPTQNCCLAHVTTQMKALEAGAQLGLMFQSIAGTREGADAASA